MLYCNCNQEEGSKRSGFKREKQLTAAIEKTFFESEKQKRYYSQGGCDMNIYEELNELDVKVENLGFSCLDYVALNCAR